MGRQKFNFQRPADNMNGGMPAENRVEALAQKLEKKEPERNEFKVIKIPRNRIVTNPKNDYPIDDIDKLADSILHFGLQQPLVVIYDIDNDLYMLEAGERRTTALDKIIGEYRDYNGDPEDRNYKDYLRNVKEYEGGYPCKINRTLKDGMSPEERRRAEAESEIRLIITNDEIREKDPVLQQKKLKRLEELYAIIYQDEPVNIIKTLAQETGLGESQIKRYRSIDKLIPELKKEFEKHNITLKEGSSYSKLSEEEQRTIYEMIQAGKTVSAAEAENMKRQKEKADQELARLQDSLKITAAQNTEALEKLRKNKEEEIKEKQAVIDNLEKDLKILKDTHTEMEKAQAEKLKAQYEAQLTSLKKERDDLEKAHAQTEEKLRQELDAAEKEKAQNLETIKATLEYETAIENWKAATDKLQKAYKRYSASGMTALPAPETLFNK
ncbi:ParB/RepB/Spo0J family partition protein [Fusibacillus kribbianus]|uniref:ParB N-terminal domain-containing protein n=1 Tax=Fusibacillus kribbianus TaxID=3044208 RepID=A0AAP4B957_9FIRM|nr:ParB N-terminal domain-containing protein [Ruminococcus sp. YH-rum2234]MDI9242326.1 ParB N-terminal domain-containing protein [Ruminococcus sp. YH-rum2234]